MSDRPDDAAALRLAAERGEIDAVLDALESLQDQSLQSLLSDLSNAIAEDRLEDARTLFGQVQRRIRERRRETEATTAAVRAVRDPGDLTLETVGSTESVADLTDYLVEAERTNSQRLELITRTGAFLTAPDADGTPDGSTVRDVIDETARSEGEFESATTSVESAIDGRTVPAVLAGLSVEVDPPLRRAGRGECGLGVGSQRRGRGRRGRHPLARPVRRGFGRAHHALDGVGPGERHRIRDRRGDAR